MVDAIGRRDRDEQAPQMTDRELVEHRLNRLEEHAVGARETERRVDTLALTLAHVEKMAIQTQTELRTRDERLMAGVARLHERLDEVVRADAHQGGREEGLREASTRTWKVVAWSVGATIAFGGLVIALLQLVLP